ncbi:MAG: hypothetical protein HWN51_06150 [Desulfobacterales bacterium]|nr:hypothetical protein [Desulfobacterales bacterium]
MEDCAIGQQEGSRASLGFIHLGAHGGGLFGMAQDRPRCPEAQELDAQPHPDDESEVGPDDTQGGPVALEGVGEDVQWIRLPFKMRE